MPDFPFQSDFDAVQARLDEFVSAVFSSLESEFLILPKGEGFVDYSVFETGYEALKRATTGFTKLTPEIVLAVVQSTPIALIVLRAMLGFTPPEWAYMATQRTGVQVSQGAVRSIDRKIRIAPTKPLSKGELSQLRTEALVKCACLLLNEGPPAVPQDRIHRLDKADTRGGLADLQAAAKLGIPYPMLLYERFLGRPFAGHKDSVSELVGDSLEVRIEEALGNAGISFRKTKRAEKIAGFDQAPDFIVPDEFAPKVVLEAKIAEDDGTARDKITRVQHLASLSEKGQPPGTYKYEVIACIGGRGFGIRREDMKKLLLATRGKVFTLKTLDRLVEYTKLMEFKTK
jgi:hypothetical protein